MKDRQSFLGRQTQPIPRTHYIGLDRSQKEVEQFINHAGLANIPELTYCSLRHELRKLDSILKLIQLVPDNIECLIIDGIGFLVKDIIKQREVGLLFADFDNWITKTGATVILIHHTAKAKQGQGYGNAREKGLGSGAWAQCSACSIIVEPVNSLDVRDNRRNITICSNDTAGEMIPVLIDTNGLIQSDPGVAEFTREDLRASGEDERTLSRRIEQWIKEGLFTRESNGNFRGRLPIL